MAYSLTYTTVDVNTTLASGSSYAVIASGLTLTLPGSPTAGDRIEVFQGVSPIGTTTIQRNGDNINGQAEDLVITLPSFWLVITYIGTYGWQANYVAEFGDVHGRISVGGGTINTAVLSNIAGTHPSTDPTIYGGSCQATFPSTATSSASGYGVAPVIPNTSYTLTNLAGFIALDAVKGASATVTNQYGFRAADLTIGTNNFAFHGGVSAGTSNWNLYMSGTAPNFIGGEVGIGTYTAGRQLNVETSSASQPVAHFRSNNASLTADVVTIFGFPNSPGYNLFKVVDARPNHKFSIRGDGLIFLGPSTTQQQREVVNISGRTYLAANDSYNLASGTFATSLYVGGPSLTVAPAKKNSLIHLEQTYACEGTAETRGLSFNINTSSASAASNSYGVIGAVANTGTGACKSIYGRAIASTGSNGCSVVGLVGAVTVNPGISPANSFLLQLEHQGNAQIGILVDSGTAGGSDTLTNGIAIGGIGNTTLLASAYQYNKHTGSGAAFLSMLDESLAQIFSVDKSGNLAFGGRAQKIMGDFDNATDSSRTIFQTRNANANTIVGVAPNGSSTTSGIGLYNNSSLGSGLSMLTITNTSTVSAIDSNVLNSGTQLPLELRMGGTAGVTITTGVDVLVGLAGSASMTAGFPYIPAASGVPGTPATVSNRVPIYYDTTNNKLYAYNGAWKSVTLT